MKERLYFGCAHCSSSLDYTLRTKKEHIILVSLWTSEVKENEETTLSLSVAYRMKDADVRSVSRKGNTMTKEIDDLHWNVYLIESLHYVDWSLM